MANEFELAAEIRNDKGKGASRRLRRNAGMVPAIVYGAGKEPVSISIAQNVLHKSCENEAFFAHIIELKVGGDSENAIVKGLQRHPSTNRIMHADFLRVRMDQEITVEVPLHFINEESCVGVKIDGGMVSHVMSSLQIACLPGNLPEFIEVDVEALEMGSSLHMSELKLPEGVSVPELSHGTDHDQVVVSVVATRATVEESDEAEPEEGAAAEGDEPAED